MLASTSAFAQLPQLPQLPQSSAQNPTRAFLRFEIPKHGAYVGESIPVTVRAYFRGDTSVTVTGAPTLDATDFMLGTTDGVQGRATIDGVTYRVLTWQDHLSPVKPGHYALHVSVPSTLEWQDVIAHRAAPSDDGDPMAGDPFGNLFGDTLGGSADPFAQMQKQMQQMMNRMNQPDFGSIQRHDVTLHAPAITLDVKALPTKTRPADFTDAVGHFTFTANADTNHVQTGEPITLALTVKGIGNFDRVNVAGIPESTDWKTYSPNSEVVNGSEPEKIFKQPIVPLHAGPSTIPATSFSYFDPDAAKYVTLDTAPIAVDVAPGSGVAASSNGKIPESTSGPTLAPNDEAIGETTASLAPLFTRRGFWEAQTAPLFVLGAGLLFVTRRRRLAADPYRAQWRDAEKSVQKYRVEMDRASSALDAESFFAAARAAIQQRLGARWHLAPAAISLSEIESRLAADAAHELRPIFDADALRFSGQSARQIDFVHWKTVVEDQLAHLTKLETS